MNGVTVRPVHDNEWRKVRDVRLRALRDEAADIAFGDTLENASTLPDEWWQQRTRVVSAEAGTRAPARHIVAVASDESWVGSLAVFLERAGSTSFTGATIDRSAGLFIGVYLDPAYRGQGVIHQMIEQGLDWLREQGFSYARLWVHADNGRAQRAYEKAGFELTGAVHVTGLGHEREMARGV